MPQSMAIEIRSTQQTLASRLMLKKGSQSPQSQETVKNIRGHLMSRPKKDKS